MTPSQTAAYTNIKSDPKRNVDLYRGLKEVGKWYK